MSKKVSSLIKLIIFGIICFCVIILMMFNYFTGLKEIYVEKIKTINSIKITYPFFNNKQDFYIEEYINNLDKQKNDQVKYIVNKLEDKTNLLFKLYKDEYIVDYYSLFFNDKGDLISLSEIIKNEEEFNNKIRAYLDNHYNISDEEMNTAHKSYLFKEKLVEIYLTNYNNRGDIALVKLNYNEIKEYINIDIELDENYNEYLTTKKTTTTKKVNVIPIIPEKGVKYVALTFDDGPSYYTKDLLKILEEYNAKASFFMVGYSMNKLPDIVLDVLAAGHEIGNHTSDHSRLTKLKKDKLLKKINDNNNTFRTITNQEMNMLRPPYGAYNNNVKSMIDVPLILWSVDSRDWESRNTNKIVSLVMKEIKAGDIVLFHDLYPTTIESIRRLMPLLVAEGYQFVTLSELFEIYGKSLLPYEVYKSAR